MAINSDYHAIKKLLLRYRNAINEASLEKVIPMFTNDGVMMASGLATAIGQNQISDRFRKYFRKGQFSMDLLIDEIEVLCNNAFVHSISKGFFHSSLKQSIHIEYRHLFILKKINGVWKIDSYIFNKA